MLAEKVVKLKAQVGSAKSKRLALSDVVSEVATVMGATGSSGSHPCDWAFVEQGFADCQLAKAVASGFREAFLAAQRHPDVCAVAVAGFLCDRGLTAFVRKEDVRAESKRNVETTVEELVHGGDLDVLSPAHRAVADALMKWLLENRVGYEQVDAGIAVPRGTIGLEFVNTCLQRLPWTRFKKHRLSRPQGIIAECHSTVLGMVKPQIEEPLRGTRVHGCCPETRPERTGCWSRNQRCPRGRQ